jgi:hypothetical protein
LTEDKEEFEEDGIDSKYIYKPQKREKKFKVQNEDINKIPVPIDEL